jgi:hypothetical protein
MTAAGCGKISMALLSHRAMLGCGEVPQLRCNSTCVSLLDPFVPPALTEAANARTATALERMPTLSSWVLAAPVRGVGGRQLERRARGRPEDMYASGRFLFAPVIKAISSVWNESDGRPTNAFSIP